MGNGERAAYLEQVIDRLWDYTEAQRLVAAGFLERDERSKSRPPVVREGAETANIVLATDAADNFKRAVLKTLPKSEWHRHFRSLRSSQALTLSVFGVLSVLDRVKALENLQTEEGLPVFFPEGKAPGIELEHAVNHLGEPRSTSVDVWLHGTYRTAIECKFTESDFGECSRPGLVKGRDTNYERDHCDGTYTHQRGRHARCTLTEIGVRYWDHTPQIFSWESDRDLSPCPMNFIYQLVRNILAAVVTPSGALDLENGHTLVLYDDRNPSFQLGGRADEQWSTAKAGLKYPHLLRRCSWRRLIGHLAQEPELNWLTMGLGAKYGFGSA